MLTKFKNPSYNFRSSSLDFLLFIFITNFARISLSSGSILKTAKYLWFVLHFVSIWASNIYVGTKCSLFLLSLTIFNLWWNSFNILFSISICALNIWFFSYSRPVCNLNLTSFVLTFINSIIVFPLYPLNVDDINLEYLSSTCFFTSLFCDSVDNSKFILEFASIFS